MIKGNELRHIAHKINEPNILSEYNGLIKKLEDAAKDGLYGIHLKNEPISLTQDEGYECIISEPIKKRLNDDGFSVLFSKLSSTTVIKF